jgi:UDP-glucose 4-epimerase
MALRILVTGAAGFIGSHTVERLLVAGHRVWGLDNFRTGKNANLLEAQRSPLFALREMDVTDEARLDDFFREVRPEAIIHLAGLVGVAESVRNPSLNERLNVDATRIVLEASLRNNVARIVFASSAAVYGDPAVFPLPEDTPLLPLSPYGSAKLTGEKILLEGAARSGLVARCQRYFNVYGPRQDPSSSYSGVISKFLENLSLRSAPTIFGDGEQTRDFVSVHDVARANVIAATMDGLASGTVNICTGRATSINELWRLIALNQFDAAPPVYAPARACDIRHSLGSPELARRELGFAASVDLAVGLEEMADCRDGATAG